MAVHRVTKILPYTPDELFMLVSDVARYPDFVPWINSMRTWGGKVDEAKFPGGIVPTKMPPKRLIRGIKSGRR